MGYPYYQNQQPQVSFMSTRGSEMVVNYPIGPGNTIIFKDEVAPYIYVKSMGYSPVDKPILEVYRREDPTTQEESDPALAKIQEDIRGIIEDIDSIKRRLKPRRKEGEDDTQ